MRNPWAAGSHAVSCQSRPKRSAPAGPSRETADCRRKGMEVPESCLAAGRTFAPGIFPEGMGDGSPVLPVGIRPDALPSAIIVRCKIQGVCWRETLFIQYIGNNNQDDNIYCIKTWPAEILCSGRARAGRSGSCAFPVRRKGCCRRLFPARKTVAGKRLFRLSRCCVFFPEKIHKKLDFLLLL